MPTLLGSPTELLPPAQSKTENRQLSDDVSNTLTDLDHMVILEVDEEASYVAAHNLCYNVSALKRCKYAFCHQRKRSHEPHCLAFREFPKDDESYGDTWVEMPSRRRGTQLPESQTGVRGRNDANYKQLWRE